MRFFRKLGLGRISADLQYKQEQRRIEAMSLIYEDNRAILQGKRETLAWSQEALENLEASIGLTRPGCAIGVGCGSIGLVGLGVLFVCMGTLSVVAAIDSLLRFPHLTPETSTTAVMLASGVVFLLFLGPGAITQSYLQERNWPYITGLYNRLIAQGQVVEGTITRMEPYLIEQVVTKQVILHYRFTIAGQAGEYEGQYKLLPDQTFAPGHKVTVLYLNRFVQVLL